MIRNPKQVGTNLFDCIPQSGKCPRDCSQCFFNREGFYTETPSVPTPEEVGDGIVRMNCGHDSNLERELVIETAAQYKHAFFNTSIPTFDFPGPVVFTANPREEEPAQLVKPPRNLMFVRLRVSGTNLKHIDRAVHYTVWQVPVVLTFMSYYDQEPAVDVVEVNLFGRLGSLQASECYVWKTRHINAYHCPTVEFMRVVLRRYADNRLVSMCGSLANPYCANCMNCDAYYWQTKKRMAP
jgi:hypothetical protein